MIKSSNKNFKKIIFNCRLCSCRSWSVGCCSAAIPSSPSTAPASATLTGTLSLVIKWTSWRRQLAYTLWFPPCRRRTALGCLLSRRPGTCIYSWKFYSSLPTCRKLFFPDFLPTERSMKRFVEMLSSPLCTLNMFFLLLKKIGFSHCIKRAVWSSILPLKIVHMFGETVFIVHHWNIQLDVKVFL